MKRRNVIIMGAAGRDFHNFNVCFRRNADVRVVAFTAAQIPFIANRRYPSLLAGRFYPRGIPIYPEAMLDELLRTRRIHQVVFAYSDISYAELMHRASLVLAAGADFSLIGPVSTMLKCARPVISVCAVRTGCGKSEVTRYLCGILSAEGLTPIVVRHPMPYGDLASQAVERFAQLEDLERYRCTIEEREEFEPLLRQGIVVYAGVDYERIRRRAEREGDIIIWDGGNNDFPFFRPDLEITVADPLRVGDETGYFPGEVNLRRAVIVIINKVNVASKDQIDALKQSITAVNAAADVIETASDITVTDPDCIAGKRVLVVEDGPTVTHGNMPGGAALAAARKFGAGEIIDPRPYAIGSIAGVYHTYSHLGPVLPAMGYQPDQIRELQHTIESTPCDVVLSATPADLSRLMSLTKKLDRVFYGIAERPGSPLKEQILSFLARLHRGS